MPHAARPDLSLATVLEALPAGLRRYGEPARYGSPEMLRTRTASARHPFRVYRLSIATHNPCSRRHTTCTARASLAA